MAVKPSLGNFCIALHAGSADSWGSRAQNEPEILDFLQTIAHAAGEKLRAGETALSVVETVVGALEDCPLFNAGKGSVLNEAGAHELEAAIIDGASGAYGAVACLENTKNPINAAAAVLKAGRHALIVGSAADDFARGSGLPMVSNDYFTTEDALLHSRERSEILSMSGVDLETVGAVALDTYGHLAAAGSTGGLTGKMKGRIGDTAIIGAGIYADDKIAVVCSGAGDHILSHTLASKVVSLHHDGTLASASERAVLDFSQSKNQPAAILAVNSLGELSVQSSARVFLTASCSSTSDSRAISNESTISLLPQHIFYEDNVLSAGLTRYPTTPWHTVLKLRHDSTSLTSLGLSMFEEVFNTARTLSRVICSATQALRCGLVSDGDLGLYLIPFHGLGPAWKPILHEIQEYHDTFPGYLTSKNGPTMADSDLSDIRNTIIAASHLSEPLDFHFDGEPTDMNLFARLVRGEGPQWRVWEDAHHVAWLTPFANTPGFTVLVPRKHLGSDIFGLEDDDYAQMVRAAYAVAQILKAALGVSRCGIFFEGFEINYAHIKIIPVHETRFPSANIPLCPPDEFHDKYEGYLSTQLGSRAVDFGELCEKSSKLRQKI